MTILNTATTPAHGLDDVRNDAYSDARMVGADEPMAAAYRRARDQLKPYPSAILFPEALLLPACDLRRQVWTVDFEVVADKDGAASIVGSRVRRLEFFDIAAEDDLAMVFSTVEEVVEANLAGIRLSLCRRLPWLDNAYDPVARLRLYLPAAWMRSHGARPAFELDALFADRADALRY